MTPLAGVFTNHSIRKLEQLLGRIVTCLGKLNHEQVWLRGGEHENSVGNLVLHLCGNVRQRIGMAVAGQPDIRHRHEEFEVRSGEGPAELSARLSGVIRDAIGTMGSLQETDLLRMTKVQDEEITVLECVAQVVEHFSMHTGQIILLTKHATGEDLGFFAHLNRSRREKPIP